MIKKAFNFIYQKYDERIFVFDMYGSRFLLYVEGLIFLYENL